ncbi:hypothetical protein VN97_g10137 [Penicillium thymicola]|uniref:Uncharacterized protein n=1 Tax=Penicillium thymicola TaxID=293382 RepID=A0AAI9T9X9_PENTH|nr:hypothetical protein VN97_g10137 [Penicillium thymicola]
MSGSQDETGLGMDESPIPGPPASTPTSTPTSSPASSPASSGTRSPIIERSERSEPLIPDIQPHGSLAALTMCSVIFYLHQAGLHNPSPLTPRAESKVHTHASINPQPMAGSLAPSDLIMTEVSPSTAGPTWSSNGYALNAECLNLIPECLN